MQNSNKFYPILIALLVLFSEGSVYAQNNLFVTYLDKNSDNVADVITVQNSNTSVAINLKNTKISKLEIYTNDKNRITNLQYAREQEYLKINYATSTNQKVFLGTGLDTQVNCANLKASSTSDISELNTALRSTLPETCAHLAESPSEIKDSINLILDKRDDFADCLTDDFSIAAGQWAFLQTFIKGIEFCVSPETYGSSEKSCTGKYFADLSQIKITPECLRSKDNLTKILQHELLHWAKIPDENSVQCIENSCPANPDKLKECAKNNSNVATLAAQTKAKGSENQFVQTVALQNGGATPAATAQINQNTVIQVPKQISAASLPQPSAADLKVTGGSRSFTVPSNSQTFPAQMIRFAENAIMPTTAYAAQPKATSSASAKTASTTHAQIKSAPTAKTSSRSIASASATTITPATQAKSISADDVLVKESTVSTKSTTRAGADSRSQGARASGGSGSAGTSVMGGAASKATANNNQRKTAPADTETVYSSEQLVSILKQDSYKTVKQRLQQDEAFVDALKKNAITIYNTRGEQIGSPTGKIIFSDTGNRFVQGK